MTTRTRRTSWRSASSTRSRASRTARRWSSSGFHRDVETRERRSSGGFSGGWFGRSTVVVHKRVELLMLLTPKIVNTAAE